MKTKGINVKFLEGLLVSLLAVFAPIKAVILVTGMLIMADTMTGILAARKRGEKISSAGLRRTVTKSLVYLTAVCMGFLVEKYMIEEFMPISKIISGVISLVELKSILENLDVINGGSLFKTVIQRLGSVNDKLPSDNDEQK
jgi:Na+/H+ antiporter NhaD/arsenite permease-like protein